MWEASRWRTDPTYHAPMVICNGKHVFAGDICKVKCRDDGGGNDEDWEGCFECAKVMSFFVDEKVHTCTHYHAYIHHTSQKYIFNFIGQPNG